MKKLSRLSNLVLSGAVVPGLVLAGQACGQGAVPGAKGPGVQPASGPGATPPAAAPPAPKPVVPADPEIEAFKAVFSGSWKASGKDPETGEDAQFWMHIAPVTVEGVDNALYVEQSRGDDPATPYRQAIFQVYHNRGKLRLRTMEMRSAVTDGGPWALSWLAPDLFPKVEMKNLIATLDLEFTSKGGSYEGRTPYPYPNADQGAVEMTSEMKLSKDKLVTTDKGYGPDGKVVWSTSGGSASPDALTWEHADPGFKVHRDDDGLVIITVNQPADGAKPVDGDTLMIDYTVWLGDGTMADAARKRGRLMPMPYPIPSGSIAGFVRGLADVTEGTVRRLIVPASLGYGDAPHGPIPPKSTLYFLIDVSTIQKPVAPAPEQPDQPAGGAPEKPAGSAPEKPENGGGH